ncbi:MAG: translocation/assembly module TamB domain-containing protein [Bryobacteraceae bacterium]
MTPFRNLLKRTAATIAILLFVGAVGGWLILSSAWFREYVRTKLITTVEEATGGRVELGTWSFDWRKMTVSMSPFILHGKEAGGEPPLVYVKSASLGLHIISVFERKVDLAAARVEEPQVRIVIYPDGTDNLPSPNHKGSNKSWAEHVVNVAIRHYEVIGGWVEVGIHKVPLDFRGEDLAVTMDYDGKGPRYVGQVSARHLRTSWGKIAPVEFDTTATFQLNSTRLEIDRVRLATGRSRFDAKGFLGNLREPAGAFDVRALLALPDAVPLFSLPVTPAGTATFDGKLTLSFIDGFDYAISGKAVAQGLGYTNGRVNVSGASATVRLEAVPDRVTLKDIDLNALGGKFTGDGQLVKEKKFSLTGNFDGLSVSDVVNVLTDRPVPWNGAMIGSLSLTTEIPGQNTKLDAIASILPFPAGNPVQGNIHVRYDQPAGTLELDDTNLSTAGTSVSASGTLGRSMYVRVHTTDLDDVLRVGSLIEGEAPAALPLQLQGGAVDLDGTISGSLLDVRFRGRGEINKASVAGHPFDHLEAQIDATRRVVGLNRLSITRGAMQTIGDARLAQRVDAAGSSLEEKWASGDLTARLDIRNAPIAELAKEFSIAEPLSGTASGTVRLTGTPKTPDANIDFDIARFAARGESFDRLRGALHYNAQAIELRSVEASLDSGRVRLNGTYTHAPGDWNNGAVTLDAAAQAVPFNRVAALRELQPSLNAKLDGTANVQGEIRGSKPLLHSINGGLSARDATLGRDPIGDVTLTAKTTGNNLALQASSKLRGTGVQAQGTWRLDGDMPGTGTITVSRMSISTLHDLIMLDGDQAPKAANTVDGFLEASAAFSVPLTKPDLFQAEVKVDAVQINAPASQALRLGVQSADVVLKNTAPILVSLSTKEAQVKSARFSAQNTDLELSGTIPFEARRGADLSVKGTVNLVILQLLNPDLLAKGNADVTATIRGSIRNPQLNGRMTLSGASLYLADVPSGIDSANGVIVFDRNRATITNLQAETGGGTVVLKGFVEFGDTLIYRLQADVRQVRVRYPADVSTTANGQLALNGTPDVSTLSGSLIVNRASIAAGADFARVIASTVAPSAGGSESGYFKGLRFDVHIESSPTFEFETSLTRNVQAQVDLRLRGTMDRPILLGDIAVSSGEVQLFGNRYNVNRGDIRFLNPVKIEPTLDVNMETRTRGITVSVSLSGSPQRLNINYSSDPPLQSREIIALLAVGRDPSATTRVSDTVATSSTDFGAAGGLLGQAVSEQLNSRLQRFFGASRVKIDPTLTGVENLPEARLTLEQQVSRDITLTYITNLNRTASQVVRVQWDLSQQWSAVAVRNSNGLFGIDILYRRRLK